MSESVTFIHGCIDRKTKFCKAIAEYEKFRPIQDRNYSSDFHKAVIDIRTTGGLPKTKLSNKEKVLSESNKSVKTPLDYNPKV